MHKIAHAKQHCAPGGELGIILISTSAESLQAIRQAFGLWRVQIPHKLVLVVVSNQLIFDSGAPQGQGQGQRKMAGLPPPYLPSISLRPLGSDLKRSKTAPRNLQVFFGGGSKSLQERSKRPLRGFLKASASKIRFGTHVDHIFSAETRP